MSARTVISHALNQGDTHALANGTRVHYAGTQDWGPAYVTIDKPWGGVVDPLYVVRLDSGRTYVVSESEVTPTRTGGVSLVKVTDDVRHWNYADCGHYAQLGPRGDYLHTNSLPLLAVFFGSSSDGGFVETV